jgi:hypothetical protein
MLEFCAPPLASSLMIFCRVLYVPFADFRYEMTSSYGFGKSNFVSIQRGALEPYISEMATFLPALNKAADEAGLLKD